MLPSNHSPYSNFATVPSHVLSNPVSGQEPCVAFSCHVSVVSWNLHLSFIFPCLSWRTLTFQRAQCIMHFLNVSLCKLTLAPQDEIRLCLFWQEYHRHDCVSFPAHCSRLLVCLVIRMLTLITASFLLILTVPRECTVSGPQSLLHTGIVLGTNQQRQEDWMSFLRPGLVMN